MERAGRKKTLETRDRILDAAEDVFNECGYSNTTLNEIAEAAGLTRGAIYWHFKNKEDLFQAMCLRIREPMDALIEGIVEKDVNDPIAQLSRTHETIMLEVINNPHYRRVLNILFHKCEFTRETDQIVIQQKEYGIPIRETLSGRFWSTHRKRRSCLPISILNWRAICSGSCSADCWRIGCSCRTVSISSKMHGR